MKRLQRAAALLTAGILMLGILSGCAEDPPPAPTTAVPEELSVCLGSAPSSLDPIRTTQARDMTVLCHLYENLLTLTTDESGAVVTAPGAAESWESVKNADGSVTYTFHLRDAKWSDGVPLLSRDFVYAWQRLANPVSKSPHSRLLSIVKGYDELQATGDVSALQVAAPNNTTFEVTVTGAFDWFLTDVCTSAAAMPLREALVQELKDAAIQKNQEDAANGLPMTAGWATDYTKLMGNGPYQITAFDEQGLVLERNAFYSGNEDGPERIRVVYADTAEDGWALYAAGTVDVLAEVPSFRLAELAQSPDWSPLPTLTTCLLLFNTEQAPLDDPLVRQALFLSVSRSALSEAAGTALTAASGLVPFGVSDPEDVDFRTHGGALIPCDAENEAASILKAPELLNQAGYDEITPLPALPLLYPDTERHAATARLLAEQWSDNLGVTVIPTAVTEEELETALADRAYSLALTDYTGYANDAQAFLDGWTSDSETNVVGYSNSAFDTLLAVIASASDDQARRGCLHDAESLLLKSTPLSPLYFLTTDFALREDLLNVTRSAAGVFRFADVCRLLP